MNIQALDVRFVSPLTYACLSTGFGIDPDFLTFVESRAEGLEMKEVRNKQLEQSKYFGEIANPSSLRLGSILFFLATLSAVFFTNYLISSELPESGKIATHWGLDGKPNGYMDVKSFKSSMLIFPAGISAFLYILLMLCGRFPSLYNSGLSRFLDSKFSNFKKLRASVVRRFSVLDAATIISTSVSSAISVCNFGILQASRTEAQEFSDGYLCAFFALLIPLIVFGLLWEPVAKTSKNKN